ncbi:MutS-related protein [Mesoterricola silvestris]|nr:hypothetical protein [Mesoterricola silvestris]
MTNLPADAPPERDLDLVRNYHVALGDAPGTVDETTWQDLAMDEVFTRMDRTVSWPGSQVLYRWMRVVEPEDRVLEERSRGYRILRDCGSWMDRARAVLKPLGDPGGAFLAPFLIVGLPEQLPRPWLYVLCALIPLPCFAACARVPWLFLPGLAFLCVNILINTVLGPRLAPYYPAFSRIHALIEAGLRIAALPDAPALPEIERLRRCRPAMARVQARLSTLSVDRSQLSELAAAFFGYLNMLFLMDIICFLRAVPALRREREELRSILETLGALDAAMGLARYLQDLPEGHVEPAFTPDRDVDIAGAWHPLLSRPVPNDLALRNRSCLVTGSNMAGKTTFIRTIGINCLLGQTLHFCLARRASLPRLPVQSSIRRSDHLEAGQSYYLAEVDRLRAFVSAGPGDPPKVLLIDEIFRGTNTQERLAASTAVLDHLQKGNLLLVTTHDLELGEALGASFDLYHFSEQVVDGTFGFDFKLRPGPVYTRNAIRLLELRGFPASITREARRLAGSGRSFGSEASLTPGPAR